MASPKRILVINGHPDPASEHLCAALAQAYVRGATAAGFEVATLDVGALDFPLIRSLKDYKSGAVTEDIARAQDAVKHAQHLVFVFPIWFGSPPALLKGFFEQLLRQGFSWSSPQSALSSVLTGKSARLIVTMGMPTSVFRFLLGGHGLAGLEKGLFLVAGVGPVRRTLLGGAHDHAPDRQAKWLALAEDLGRRGT
ncbi:MAG: NAD(P)H-dependent oxidoreductase [Caulobacter sp.]|nr:NAD(P)H-dependent oxidoreductase [Caulobacter sp.]